MTVAGLVLSALLMILHLGVVATVDSKTGMSSRILEVLRGPLQKGPVPSTKTALLLCQHSGSENADMELLRSTGVPEALMLSAHRNPKKWPDVLDDLVASYPEHMVSVVLDLGCPGAMDILHQANTTKMFGSPYRWLLIYTPSNETTAALEKCTTQAESVLGSLAIFLDSEVISMCRYGEGGESGLIIEWYRVYLTENPFVGELGSWQDGVHDSRIRWTERSLKPMAVRRSNLRQLPLHVGFLLRFNESLKHLEDGYDTRKDTMTKFFWPILHNTADMLNGTLVPKWSDNWGFPINKSLKNWDGMAGMQMRGEVDISGIPAVMENVRSSVLSFVSFRGPSAGLFIFRAPPMSYEANLFALPFPDTLWAAAGGLIAICVLLLYLVLTAEDIMDKDEIPSAPPVLIQLPLAQEKSAQPSFAPATTEEETADNMVVRAVSQNAVVAGDGIQAKARLHGSWSDVMLLVFGAICQQGSPAEARTIPGRIVTISMLIGIIFLFTSYSASIVVLLQSTSNSIRTLDDLWKSRLPCGGEDVNYNKYYFRMATGNARVGIFKKILKKNKKNPSGNNFMSLEKGMERVRRDYFAFHSLTTSMYPIISDTWQEHEKCALRTHIDTMVYPQNPDISTSKYSPLLEVFRITLRKMHERGIRKREIARVIPAKPVCTNPGSNFSSVSIMDSYFAMVILTTGVLASLLVLGLEHLAFRRLKKAAKEAAAAAEAAAHAAARIRERLLTPKRI